MSTDEQTREIANDLVSAAVNYARRALKKFGEFGPFGFSMNTEREITRETLGADNLPADTAMLLDLLRRHLSERAQMGEIIAAATAINVSMTQSSEEGFTDAVLVEIEHQNGYCTQAFIPYRIAGGQYWKIFPRVVRFGAVRVQNGSTHIFATD